MRGVRIDPGCTPRARARRGAVGGRDRPRLDPRARAAGRQRGRRRRRRLHARRRAELARPRRYGLASNHVTAIELVTADGPPRPARTPSTEADLFWALRGGGGNFGVVTAIEFELFAVGELHGRRAAVAVRAGRGDLQRVAGVDPDACPTRSLPCAGSPPSCCARGAVRRRRGRDPGPPPTCSRPCGCSSPSSISSRRWRLPALIEIHNDPKEPAPRDERPPHARRRAPGGDRRAGGRGRRAALVAVELRHLGGALGRIPAGHGALDALDGEFRAVRARHRHRPPRPRWRSTPPSPG